MNITTDSIESNDGVRIHYVDAGRGEPLLCCYLVSRRAPRSSPNRSTT